MPKNTLGVSWVMRKNSKKKILSYFGNFRQYFSQGIQAKELASLGSFLAVI
jgi:hypothetical protein